MPNYITNKLVISSFFGEKNPFLRQVAQARRPSSFSINKIIGESFSFKNVVPPPKGVNPGMSLSSSEWFIREWGTKWDASEVEILSKTESEVVLTFQTAWSPPFEWIKKVCSIFDDIKIKLYWVDEDYSLTGLSPKDYPTSGKVKCSSYFQIKFSSFSSSSENDEEKEENFLSVAFEDEEAEKFVKKHFPEKYSRNHSLYKVNILLSRIQKRMSDVHRGIDIFPIYKKRENSVQKIGVHIYQENTLSDSSISRMVDSFPNMPKPERESVFSFIKKTLEENNILTERREEYLYIIE